MSNKPEVPTLEELYPDASPDQLQEIELAIHEYIEIVMDMYNRISADPEEYARFQTALTKRRGGV